jgi:hypothetical protein
MRKLYFMATLFMSALVSNPAAAITGRFVEDFEHPFVGLATFYDASGEFIGRCSGSLLSPSLFLTAGHCIEGAASARVYFQQDAGVHYDPVTQIDPITGYPESCLSQPCTTSSELISFGYPAGFPNTRDAALLVLDEPIALSEYGALAAAGTLDALARPQVDRVHGQRLRFDLHEPGDHGFVPRTTHGVPAARESQQRADGRIQSADHQQSGHRRRQLFR